MTNKDRVAEAIGPRPSVMVCKGCPAYETKSWSEIVEDERDSGQYAWCKAANRRSMGSYHYDHNPAPSWCPALTAPVPESPERHSDDDAVDSFAAALKAKMAKKRSEGRGGWDDPEQCGAAFLSKLMREHVVKGDPLDVGAFAMMLQQRGEPIQSVPESPGACACPEHGNWIAADDVDRLVRELDVLLNGEAGAAKQASLCDIVSQVASQHFILVRHSESPGAEEIEAIRARVQTWPATNLDNLTSPLTPFGEACNDRATLLSALDAERAARVSQGWQPIETAPRNARNIILRVPCKRLHPDHRLVIAHWACDLSGEEQPPFKGWFYDDGHGFSQVKPEPTHWQPLAASPEGVRP